MVCVFKIKYFLQQIFKILQDRRTNENPNTILTVSFKLKNLSEVTYFGSGGPSDSGFIDSLHNDLNTRKASFCKMWENLAPGEGPEEFPDS